MRDEMIDAALRNPPEVHLPPHFANRVLANLSEVPVERNDGRLLFPALTLAGSATLASLAWAAYLLGFDRWLTQPPVLVSILGLEAVVSLGWAWRVYRAAR